MEQVEVAQSMEVAAVSLATAGILTGWSERTLWRRLAAGCVQRAGSRGARVFISWSSLQPHVPIQLDEEGLGLLLAADAGQAGAQAELAVLLMEQRQMERAMHWLQQAASAGQAEAMHWLGRLYLAGEGLPQDRNLGLMWLARSACAGHSISSSMLDAVCAGYRRATRCVAGVQPRLAA